MPPSHTVPGSEPEREESRQDGAGVRSGRAMSEKGSSSFISTASAPIRDQERPRLLRSVMDLLQVSAGSGTCSRSRSRVARRMRETCICDTPIRFAISC
jgi:hypothetical protein